MTSLRPVVVHDVDVFVNAVVGEDSQRPYLTQVPPATSDDGADCLSVASESADLRLFVSLHVLENVACVLRSLGWTRTTVEEHVEALTELVETSDGSVLDPERQVFDVPDFEDTLVLDPVVACDALLVVSDDADLTALSPWHQRIAILRPCDAVRRTVRQRRDGR